ncbi:MAG: DUF2000 family protein, partial [Intestinibacter sp.]
MRHLCCKNEEYNLSKGDLLLFNPNDNHVCSPINNHLGIIEFPVPILKANKEKIKEIRTKLYDEKYKDVVTV